MEKKIPIAKKTSGADSFFVKDDSVNNAVFAEQSAPASYMTTAKVWDVISRLPDCSRQASDAVSANMQVKVKDAPEFLHLSEKDCPQNLDQNTESKKTTTLGLN